MAREGEAQSRVQQAWGKLRANLQVKNFWQELSGSLGDLGTFIPLVLALTFVNNLNLGTTLIFTGIYNIVTGGLFGVPMPVQPMKSIAAVAVTAGNPLTVPQIMAAGLTTAILLFFLGVTGSMTVVQKYVPFPIVRGIQLGQGIQFGNLAVAYIMKNQDFSGKGGSAGTRPWLGLDGKVLALSAFAFVIILTGVGGGGKAPARISGDRPSADEESLAEPLVESGGEETQDSKGRGVFAIPTALLVFVVGLIIAIIRDPGVFGSMKIGPSPLTFVNISLEDWKIGFFRGAIPQIPLSILNSVIAVCKLSHDLFPSKDVTPQAVSSSVGIMNLVGCWFGAMPVCHGAGGLAGQYRFGAQSGLSVALLGTAKLIIGLVLGSSLLQLLSQFPIGLLGVLLFFSGIELAMACRDQSSRLDSFVMLTVVVVSLGGGGFAWGFICGLVLWLFVKGHEKFGQSG